MIYLILVLDKLASFLMWWKNKDETENQRSQMILTKIMATLNVTTMFK